MAFKFQLGEARMSGSLIQEGDFQLLDDDGTVRVTMARDNGSITGSAMSLSDGDLTNVGAIKCDVIEPDAAGVGLSLVFGGNTTLNKLSLTDNLADALNIEEGGASYMKFVTTNGSEQVVFGKNSTFASTTIADLGTVTTADIDGGTIDGATIATSDITVGTGKTLNVSAGTLTTSAAQDLAALSRGISNNDSDQDFGAFDVRAATLTADGLTATRVVFAGANGLLSDDADLTFSGDTLTATKIGAFEAAGAINFSDEAMTNVNIDSGAIDGAVIGANSAAAATVTTLTATSTLSAQGNVDLGNATSDRLTVNARLTSSVVPSDDSSFDLGTSALRWSTIYVDSIVGADVNFDVESVASGGTISAGTDYALVTSGGGTVTLPAAAAGKRIYVKLGNATANVTLAAAGGDALPEVTGSLILESTGSAVTLVAIDATNWYIQ